MPRRADKTRGRKAPAKGSRVPSAGLFDGPRSSARRPRMDKADTKASVVSDTEDLDMPSATARERRATSRASSNGSNGKPTSNGKSHRRETADTMAAKQRDIAV